ncbi:MAG TPA: nicotinate-nucleotide adenylyltransferase [Luteimonas sp.]|nr:nicotinate-nucleotide adenylyltransferase [Luteimonas sp.]
MAALLLLYGGTFDPVHNGHLAIASAAHDALDCDVHMMPAADPPHRAPPGANAADRSAMLQLAIAGDGQLLLDRRELERGGRSYSIDTVRALRAELGAAAPIALLVGADSFVGLPTWKSWRALFDLVHFVVAERLGNPLDGALPAELANAINGRWADSADVLRDHPAGKVLRLRQPLQAHSATDLRQRIASGLPWRHLLPPAVADYIQAHGLYRSRNVHPSPL